MPVHVHNHTCTKGAFGEDFLEWGGHERVACTKGGQLGMQFIPRMSLGAGWSGIVTMQLLERERDRHLEDV